MRGRSTMAPTAVETSPKKTRLTVKQLASYDDVITDVLVDHVFASHTTRKNLHPWEVRNYKHSRGVSGEDVTRILFQDVVLAKVPDKALQALLNLPGIKKYLASLPSDREKQDFVRHMQKYITIWLPECPFEVSFTNRYEIDQWEARTTARKFVRGGDLIKFMCGNLVSMTTDEEEDESFISNAFSITYSSRKKTKSLFLGPARFANHDCNANAKLESRGGEGMVVIAVRDIEPGDEITVDYGNHFFGDDNCECLCASCEKEGTGMWRPSTTQPVSLPNQRAGSESDHEEPGSRRSKRKRHVINYTQKTRERMRSRSEEEEVKRRKVNPDTLSTLALFESDPKIQLFSSSANARQPTKTSERFIDKIDPQHAAIWAQLGQSNSPRRDASVNADARMRGRTTTEDLSRASTPSRRRPLNKRKSVNSLRRRQRDGSSASHGLFAFLKRASLPKTQSVRPSPAESDYVVPSIEPEEPRSQISSVSSEANSIFDQVERQSASPLTDPSGGESSNADDKSHAEQVVSGLPRVHEGVTESKANSLPSDVDAKTPADEKLSATITSPVTPQKQTADVAHHKAINKLETPDSASATPVPSTEVQNATPAVSIEEAESPDDKAQYRIPGDYIRTDRLLGPKNSRWVECRTCDEFFIQHEANQTRRECPRCERHSKLYGFQWPQTDHERGGPERVMDHRTVNRFLSRLEEMSEPKHRTGPRK